MNHKIVKVIWKDIQTLSEWNDMDFIKREMNKKYFQETIGYLLEDNKEFLVIAPTFSPDDPPEYSDTYIIPKGCVKKVVQLLDFSAYDVQESKRFI